MAEKVEYILSLRDQFSAPLNQARSAVSQLKAGLSVMLPVLGAAGLGAAFASVVKTGSEFTHSMANVKAMTQATGAQMIELREQAIKLGADTVFSAKEAADAQGILAQAGLSVNDIMKATPGVMSLAATGQISMAQAADIATSALFGYGMEANEINRINDVLAKTAIATNTDIEGLAEGFKYVAPIAKDAGIEFEELNAMMGILANSGIKASMGGTAIRAALAQMMTGPGAETIKQMGINIYDTAGKLRPMADILDELGKQNLSTAQKMEIFGKVAGPGMSVLLSAGGDKLRAFTEELRNAGGTAEMVARQKLDSFKGVTEEASGATDSFAISIFDRMQPALKSLVKGYTSVVESLTDFVKISKAQQLKEQQTEVNKLASILMSANAPLEARNQAYIKLKDIQPAILANMTQESINISAMRDNLRAYNKETANRIMIANLSDDEQKKMTESARHMEKAMKSIYNTAGTDVSFGKYLEDLRMMEEGTEGVQAKLAGKQLESVLDLMFSGKYEAAKIALQKVDEQWTNAFKEGGYDQYKTKVAANMSYIDVLMRDINKYEEQMGKYNETQEDAVDLMKMRESIEKQLGITNLDPVQLSNVITGDGVNDPSGQLKDLEKISKITAEAPKVFNINIEGLIKADNGSSAITISTQNVTQSQGQLKNIFTNLLVESLQDVQTVTR